MKVTLADGTVKKLPPIASCCVGYIAKSIELDNADITSFGILAAEDPQRLAACMMQLSARIEQNRMAKR